MDKESSLPQRKITRLPFFDYRTCRSYSVTICTVNRACLFGEVVNGTSLLSDLGRIVEREWLALPEHYAGLVLDEFVIMPNHIHGILFLDEVHDGDILKAEMANPDMASHVPTRRFCHPQSRSLSSIIGSFKSGARRIHGVRADVAGVWQSRFHEHIIRDAEDLTNHRRYIRNNPANWATDKNNP